MREIFWNHRKKIDKKSSRKPQYFRKIHFLIKNFDNIFSSANFTLAILYNNVYLCSANFFRQYCSEG